MTGLRISALRNANRQDVSRWLFFAGYGLWLVWKLITMTMLSFPDGSLINTAFHGLSLALVVVSVCISFSFDRSFRLFLLALAVACAVKVCADDFTFIDVILILYSSKGVTFRAIAKYTFGILVVYLLAVVLMSQLGVIADYPFTRGNRVLHGLGFRYRTYASHFLLAILLLLVYLRRGSLHLVETAIMLAASLAVYVLTDARNSFILSLFVIIVSVVGGFACRRFGLHAPKPMLRVVSQYSFVILSVLMLAMSMAYNSNAPIWASLNKVLSSRLSQTQASFQTYGVRLFGQDIELVGNSLTAGGELTQLKETVEGADANYVDSAYLNLLINDGIVITILFLVTLTVAGKAACDADDYALCLVWLVIAVHLAVDFQFGRLYYNAFLFLAWEECCRSLGSLSFGRRPSALPSPPAATGGKDA